MSDKILLPVRVARCGDVEVPLPQYQTAHAAGMDLHAALREPVTLAPMERKMIPTGLRFAIPPGWEGQVRPRSGLALHHGITVLNAPGTIDADFRGEVQVLLIHLGSAVFEVQPLMRIAQLVIGPHAMADIQVVPSLDVTARGDGGYGSTGT